MLQRAYVRIGLLIPALFLIRAQDMKLSITGGTVPTVAIPDLRGAGESQKYAELVNTILWDDISTSGLVKTVPKIMYPHAIPQQPADLLPSGAPFRADNAGRRLSDWSGPPVSANYLVFGYAASQNGLFVLYGWLCDTSRGSAASAQVIGSRYIGSLTEEGARKAAHEFAADIIAAFGGKAIYGTHIYFTSDRTGHKEIWAMDADGANQRQITRLNFIAQYPSISPDGSKVAFTGWPGPGMTPRIFVYSSDPVRDLHFRNRESSSNAAPSFTPDGRHIVYASAVGNAHRVFMANLDGSDARQVTTSEFDDAEPKVSPKTGQQVVFSSGRSGPQQIYMSNLDGADIQKLTDGTGEASNPSWHPNGQLIAFAWTRGFSAGKFNIFWMDAASREYVQLTHSEGKNENPSWDPGGTHLVFGSNRGGSYQIWSMLADGSNLRQLTTKGNNTNPVWGR
jgi:TolB protein